MPKIDYDKYAKGIFGRTELYSYKVRKDFELAVDRLLAISANINLPEGEVFSFNSSNRLEQEANAILRNLYANVYQDIHDGITSEWNYANMSADALVKSVFGKVAESDHFARYFVRNQEAMQAFLNRASGAGGLNLSQKIWNYTGQLKQEMELALSVSLGSGESASTISRKVRGYLKEPDRLFRRVRDEKGNLQLSKAAKAYHPGRGVYRSSYKNAMRLTRTETNMAYRTADQMRWSQMDFVVGIEIRTSNNHPDPDICDDLKGKYPKDFKFVGWHPQCRCHAIPILAPLDDVRQWSEDVLNGKESFPDYSKYQITEMPKNWDNWVKANADRIANAESVPYFLKYNFSGGDPEGLPLWNTQTASNNIIKTANNVLKVAGEYSGLDTSGLTQYVVDPLANILEVKAQTEKLAQEILAIQKQEKALADLIPDVHELQKQFSMAEIQTAADAVKDNFSKWCSKYGYSSTEAAPAAHLKAKAEWELNEVVSSKKYKTWPVAESAYKNQIALAESKLEVETLKAEAKQFEPLYKITKSKPFKEKYEALQDALASGDTAEAKKCVTWLNNKKIQLNKAHTSYKPKKAAKGTTASTTSVPETGNTAIQTAHPTRYDTDKEKTDQIMSMCGVDKREARDFLNAVKGFSWQWDYEIRAYQCGVSFTSHHGHTLAEVAKKAEDLEKFIEKSPKWRGPITFRGMSLSQKDLDALLADLERGEGNMLGAASWSTNVDVSSGFARMHLGERSRTHGDELIHPVLLKIKQQKMATSIRHLSKLEHEDEVLASSKIRYRKVSVQKVKQNVYGRDYDFIVIEVEAV